MDEWTDSLSDLTAQQRFCMEFLQKTLPKSDLDTYPAGLFLQFIDHALFLRESVSWCAELDEELFLHYVLCPRVNDEDLSFHRALFYGEIWPEVAELDMENAVLAVNRWCHSHASYQAQDDRTASPLTVFRSGSGRCGEESAFLVAALRSVGLPARQVYAPRWSHCDDNHAWAEVLAAGKWRFLGACEPEPVLDRGWFNTAASRALLIHSRTFGAGKSPLHGEPLGVENGVARYNQTARYARTEERVFTVTRGAAPAAGAKIRLYVLNESALYPIAVLTAGSDGRAAARLGLGDVWVRAELDGQAAEGLNALHLELDARVDRQAWTDFDFRAPADFPVNPAPLNEAQKKIRAEDRVLGDARRQARLQGMYDAGRAAACPGCDDLLREARGNFEEIFRFLSRDANPLREKLLRTLSRKDLRDVTAAVLEDHLQGAAHFAARWPEKMFLPYVLCPRVADEPLTAWRGILARGNGGVPAGETDNYGNLYWPPDAAVRAGRCNEKSRDVLAVARLRAAGIPARLRRPDGVPEVWREDGFHALEPEEMGRVTFTAAPGQQLTYRLNWSLARKTAGGWKLLDLDRGTAATRGGADLPAGEYRVITSARLPVGDQLASMREFPLRAGEEAVIPLRLRDYALAEMLYRRALPPVPAERTDGDRTGNALNELERPALLFWLEDGAEPTEHVLNELREHRTALCALPADIVFFLRGRGALEQRTLKELLRDWPGIGLYFDDWAYDAESLSRFLGQDPDRPPLAVAWDGGGAAYADCGYRVGSVALLVRVLEELCH